jgi:hypothetical protein
MMLKRCVAILLIIVLTVSSFQPFLVYAGFKINQRYIAKTLCINRSRPWMHCNGRCYFMRKLKAAEENEKKQTEKENLSRLEVTFFQAATRFEFQPTYSETTAPSCFALHSVAYNNPYLQSLFRPPQV